MKFNSKWNAHQCTNCNHLLKVRDPNEHKRQQKAFFQKKLEELDEYDGPGRQGDGDQDNVKNKQNYVTSTQRCLPAIRPAALPGRKAGARKIKSRTERKRNRKLSALAEGMVISRAAIKSLEEEMAAMATTAPKAYKFVPTLPIPTSWKEDELQDKVLKRTIPTAVADARASSNCDAPPSSQPATTTR